MSPFQLLELVSENSYIVAKSSFLFRAEDVLKLINLKEPSMTPLERARAETLIDMENEVKELAVRMKQLKKKTADRIEEAGRREQSKEVFFKKNQEETIKSQLDGM